MYRLCNTFNFSTRFTRLNFSWKLSLCCVGIFVFIFMIPATDIGAVEKSPIGFIKKMQASAVIVRDNISEAAEPGAPVFENDILKTDDSGALGITFSDNTMISLGPDTEFTVNEYVFQPEAKKMSFLSRIVRGTLHYISGTMAKLSPQSVSVNTPVGTIGIRGTRFLVKVED